MAGLPWIKVLTELPDHPKSLALALRLNDPRAWSYPVAVWFYAGRHVADGRFPDAATVEAAARWTGEPGVLAEALAAARFLDKRGRGFVIHNWEGYQSAHVERREKDRAQKRAKRAEQREKRRRDVGATSATVGATSDVSSLSPSPSPSPSRSQASKGRDDPGRGDLPATSASDTAAAPPAPPAPAGPALSAAFEAELDRESKEAERRDRTLAALGPAWRTCVEVAAALGRKPKAVEADLWELKRQGRVERADQGNPAAPVTHWRRVRHAAEEQQPTQERACTA